MIAEPKKKVKYGRRRSDEVCPHCGLKYERFKTGMTSREVSELLWSHNEDPETWKYRRRNTVLGKWREIKQEMWEEHLFWCFAEKSGGRDGKHRGGE